MSLTLSLTSTVCEWKCGCRGTDREQGDVKGGGGKKKCTEKMRQGQEREEEIKRRTHIFSLSFWHTCTCFVSHKASTHIDNVSGGLFLTQMNSESTKALSCFLRIVVVEVAYRFLFSYWQHLFCCEWELAETNCLSQKQPALIVFHKTGKKKLHNSEVLFTENSWVHFKNISHWFLLKAFL